MSLPLRICGNSHVGALLFGAPEVDDAISVIPIGNGKFEPFPFTEVDGESVRLTNEEYAANVSHHTGTGSFTRDSTWAFLTVNHTARVFRDATWQTFEPSSLAGPGKQPVTQEVLKRVIERDQTGVRLLFAHAQEAGLDFFAVSAPPPRRDHPAAGRVRPEVIAYIDHTYRAIWAAHLAERGIDLVQPPPEAFAPDGFLEERFNLIETADGRRDQHHANATYGALMRARVAAHHLGRAAHLS